MAGLSFFEANSAGEIMSLLHMGNRRRTTESTRCNATSSRSHAVLQVLLEAQHADGHAVQSKLSLIDLAGSERAIATDQRRGKSGACVLLQPRRAGPCPRVSFDVLGPHVPATGPFGRLRAPTSTGACWLCPAASAHWWRASAISPTATPS